MFNIDEYLRRPFDENIIEIKIQDDMFLIKRLDGIDQVRLYDCQTVEKRFIYILANSLIDGKTKKPIGEQMAYVFLRQYSDLASEVITKINELTETVDNVEDKALSEETKNSEQTVTPSSNGNIVNGSDSTPSEQESQSGT